MPFSKLKIDQTEYSLSYDFNAIADAEPVAGCNLLSAIENLSATTATQMRGLVYAMTRQQHPGLDLFDIGKLIRIDTIADVITAMGEACALAVSEEYAEKYRAAVTEVEPEPEPVVAGV